MFSSEVDFNSPKERSETLHNLILAIGPHLFKNHGSPVLQLLIPIEQEKIHRTTWYEETSLPIMEIRYILGDIEEDR